MRGNTLVFSSEQIVRKCVVLFTVGDNFSKRGFAEYLLAEMRTSWMNLLRVMALFEIYVRDRCRF